MRQNPGRGDTSDPVVDVLIREDGPLSPEQLALWLRKQAARGLIEKLAVAMRGRDGVWRTTWSDVTPDELLAAGVAMKLDTETAWADIQEQAAAEDAEDVDPDE